MNIVLVSSAIIPNSIGGIEVLTVLLAKAFVALGHHVVLYTGGNDSIRTEDGVEIHEIPELRLHQQLKSFLMPQYARRLQHRLAGERSILQADIINAVDLDSITALAGWKKISHIFLATVQDYGLICANGLLLYGNSVCPVFCHHKQGFACLAKRRISFVRRWYLELAYRIRKRYRDKTLQQLTHVICVSEFVAAQIRKIAPGIRIDVIGNCLPNSWVYGKAAAVKKDIDVLYAGRLESFKGADVFLQALKKLPANPPRVIYAIGGGKAAYYKKKFASMHLPHEIRVLHAIPFEQMKEYYQRSTVVVVPSVWPEPCGRVIIEGMFWKGVVVSTSRGGTPELITPQNGFLVPSGNSTQLASVIHRVLGHPKMAKAIALRAHAQAKKLYTQKHIAGLYLTAYRRRLREAS